MYIREVGGCGLRFLGRESGRGQPGSRCTGRLSGASVGAGAICIGGGMSASAAAGSRRSCVLRDGPRLSAGAGTLGAEGAPASRNLTGTAVAGFEFWKGPGAGATRPTARPAGACTCCITPIAFALPVSSDAADARCIEYSYEGGCIDRRPEETADEEATEEEELANEGVE